MQYGLYGYLRENLIDNELKKRLSKVGFLNILCELMRKEGNEEYRDALMEASQTPTPNTKFMKVYKRYLMKFMKVYKRYLMKRLSSHALI